MVNEQYRALGAAPSGIRELFAYGLMKKQELGEDWVFDYSIGNPSIPSPDAVNRAIVDIILNNDSVKIHGYTMAGGSEEVRRAVAEDLAERYSTEVKSSELFFTCGAAPALVSVVMALRATEESEIMVVAPYFPEYIPFISINGLKPVVVPADTENFQIDIQAVEERISANTQAIIINSPNNPSGVVYTVETMRALAAVLENKSKEYGHPVYIISDEPYRELVYGGVDLPFLPEIYKNTIVCYSYSKSLSLPGERIGYVYVPGALDDRENVYNAVAGAARATGHVCAPSLMQAVIARCAKERPNLEAYDRNRILLYTSLREMGYECAKPDGAFYLLVKAPGGDANAYSEKAKLKHNLLVVPADSFGCPGYFRLSYCVAEDMIIRSLPAFMAMIEE